MPYKLAIFDFDGTLADSFPFFGGVFNRLARHHGFRSVLPHEVAELRRMTARDIMLRLGVPAWKLPIVSASFIRLMNENTASVPLFEGMSELIADLSEAGMVLAIVSSNSRQNVERVLGASNLARVQACDCGASIFGKRSRIRKVLKKTGIGAGAWGYGDPPTLQALGPDQFFTHIDDIRRIVTML